MFQVIQVFYFLIVYTQAWEATVHLIWGSKAMGGERINCKLYRVNYSASLGIVWAQVETVSHLDNNFILSANIK